MHTKLKYFNASEDNKNYNIDSQNFGILETLKYRNHTVGLGYQQIVGDAYPLPDGFYLKPISSTGTPQASLKLMKNQFTLSMATTLKIMCRV